jgi:hypothetical protein
MAFARPMNKVEGIIAQRNLLVVDNHFDGTSPKPARHFRNVSSALLHGAEETQIVGAYPAQLQALLQARGIDAQVTNAGVPFDTTRMMLRRIDTDVPNGTDIVIVQPGIVPGGRSFLNGAAR